MMPIHIPQARKIYKSGNEEFDLEHYRNAKNNLFHLSHLEQKILSLEESQIVDFLDYQFNHSEYKTAFLYFTESAMKTVGFQNEQVPKISKGTDWIKGKLSFDYHYKSEIEDFFEIEITYDREKTSMWKRDFQEFIDFIDVSEKISVAEFSKNLISEKFELYLLVCKNELPGLLHKTYRMKLLAAESALTALQIQKNGNEKEIKSIKKMQWLGTQKELAELFIELKKKGWISGFEYKAIQDCFTKSKTIDQVLKPGTDRKSKEEIYDQVFTKKYNRIFNKILENPKKLQKS